MEEIEVGEYVRTKDGIIDKVEGISWTKLILHCEKGMCIDECNRIGTHLEDIVKHSKQLIDLIECGDFVNGREVKHIAMFEGFPDYPKLIFVDETHLIPDDTCENDEIQTILTKEQIAANCYKVGGEYE